jgi:hypothetical protein
VIPEDDAVHELPSVTNCLWCGAEFENSRAAAAHQARWCEVPASKREMAEQLGINAKRLRRWMHHGRIPRVWAKALGFENKLGPRIQCCLQNDLELWYPRTLELDYEFGKFIGLYAAEGSTGVNTVSFALHANENHLQSAIARFARSLGLRAHLELDGNRAVVNVHSKLLKYLIEHFIGGENARTKFFKSSVYAAPAVFRHGIVDGLIEGDGHWSHEEQRESYASASPDLAMFVRREVEARNRAPTVRRFENDHAGGWTVRFDPIKHATPISVVAVEDIGLTDLVDISIADRDELFVLANGLVTHNCKIGMGYHYRARYECVLFFEKGKRKLLDLGTADIIQSPRINGGYPAEKPPEVSEVLIKQSTQPGQLVIDPFCGSGSVGLAAVRNERDFWGNDLCAEAIDITRERLREHGAREGPRERRAEEVPQLGLTL